MKLPLRLYWIALLLLLPGILAACRPAPTGSTPTPAFSLTTPPAEQVPAGSTIPPSLMADTTPAIPSNATLEPGDPSPTGEPQATLAPTAEDLPDPHYRLEARLDYQRHFLEVSEEIRYTNRSGEPISELLLMVEPAYYPDVFRLVELSQVGGDGLGEPALSGAQLHIPLTSPLQPAQEITLALRYELNLPSPQPSPQTRPVPFGYTARQTNLVDWYPFIPPYVAGQGWLAHQAGYFGEHLVYETADFEVSLQVQSTAQSATNEIIIAASAPAREEGDWLHYQLKRARNFAWSASHAYQVYTAQVGEVTVLSYAFPFHPTAGQRALQTTAEALELYSRLLGPYPHPSLSVVEADFLDGMEFEGLYFLSNGFYNIYDGSAGSYLVTIAAHETAHQWWFGMVANDQALEPWLDEALCTYAERLYYEHVAPESLDWWWNVRVNFYSPQGWVDGSIYNPQGYIAYRNAVYLNGALFLEELRKLIGDETFFEFLLSYTQENQHQIATRETFFTRLEQMTDADIVPLVAEFFQAP